MAAEEGIGRQGPAADFVIIGAGSAGCALAERLTRSGRYSVLLLEAGPDDRRISVQVPLGYGMSFYDPAVNWMYWSEPVPGLDGRSVYVPRGKIIGGSSAINAMVYLRGLPGDFDDWERAGNPGWGSASAMALYDRIEAEDLPVTTMAPLAHSTCKAFFAATDSIGLPRAADLNRDEEGMGFYPVTIAGGRRLSAARAFLQRARRRRNLTIVTGAEVTRLDIEGSRCTGVDYSHREQRFRARAGREVILSAGAINSPQLLQLSGIGPGALLHHHGITVVKDNPWVGENLQDHPGYDITCPASVPTLNQEIGPLVPRAFAALRYLLARTGPLAGSLSHAGGYVRSAPDLSVPDLQLYFCPSSYDRAPPKTRKLTRPDPFPAFSLCMSLCRPASRGHVRIRSASPTEPPSIQPNLLGEDADVPVMLAGARLMERIAAAAPLRRIMAANAPAPLDDEARIADIRARAYSAYHPCGTCRMGPDPSTSVVDPRLRVHGVGGLRVIDSAIFPNITAGNINAPSMLVGVKGAELVLEDYGSAA
ncbi:GMC family oxidoreductase [Rhodoligotrophos defluvii]|uniref:GMC family oxidoreductase n=1 Tax=Rhodoligotrophos defluvii TaxID=2561934 RepID=UPI001EEFB10A|nr:GMC family oxidoreductase N-terminal domain-containing protein [Rhodoligotrophos defluvii]